MLDLARTLCCENEYREAENIYGTVLEISGGVLSSHKLNDNVERATKGMGRVYRLQERFEESETQLRLLLDAVK
jgi:hypothetical protein